MIRNVWSLSPTPTRGPVAAPGHGPSPSASSCVPRARASSSGPSAALVILIALATGCAAANTAPTDRATQAEDQQARARAACEATDTPTAECLDVLTRPEIESRAQVEAAEAAREADAFRGRLADLRAAVEQRQKRRRVVTTTQAVARLLGRSARSSNDPPRRPPELPSPEPPPDLRAEADESEVGTALDSLEAEGGRTPKTDALNDSVPRPAGAATGSNETEAGAAAPAATPEQYLRAARCLLDDHHAVGLAALKTYRRQSTAEADKAGRWALVLTDVMALADRVSAEIAHRRLAKAGPVCESSSLRPLVALLGTLVGPAPSTFARARQCGRGLTRLDRELQIRAGLPRAE